MAFALPAAAVAAPAIAGGAAATAATTASVAGPGLAFFGSMGAATSAGAVTAGSAAAAGSGLFAGLSAIEALQFGLQAFSFLGSSIGGLLEGNELDRQAERADLAAEQEITRGTIEANRILEAEIDALAASAARFGAAGVQLGAGGTPEQVEEAIERGASREIDIARGNAEIGRLEQQSRAQNLRRQGTIRRVRGFTSGLAGLAALRLS